MNEVADGIEGFGQTSMGDGRSPDADAKRCLAAIEVFLAANQANQKAFAKVLKGVTQR
jgi:hypothetical protein